MSGGVTGTRGQRIYGQHGNRHNPRGSDPASTDIWIYVDDAATAWSSGNTYVATDTVSHLNANWVATAGSTNVEPGVASTWPSKWQYEGPCFVNGGNAGGPSANPVPLRFRLSVGPPNECEYSAWGVTLNSGPPPTVTPSGANPFATAILAYTDHQIEIQGDVTGLVIGDTVFVIPLEYQHDYDVPYHTHDDLGGYIPCRLLVTGEFIWNTP